MFVTLRFNVCYRVKVERWRTEWQALKNKCLFARGLPSIQDIRKHTTYHKYRYSGTATPEKCDNCRMWDRKKTLLTSDLVNLTSSWHRITDKHKHLRIPSVKNLSVFKRLWIPPPKNRSIFNKAESFHGNLSKYAPFCLWSCLNLPQNKASVSFITKNPKA